MSVAWSLYCLFISLFIYYCVLKELRLRATHTIKNVNNNKDKCVETWDNQRFRGALWVIWEWCAQESVYLLLGVGRESAKGNSHNKNANRNKNKCLESWDNQWFPETLWEMWECCAQESAQTCFGSAGRLWLMMSFNFCIDLRNVMHLETIFFSLEVLIRV